jgi:hypothetical protein
VIDVDAEAGHEQAKWKNNVEQTIDPVTIGVRPQWQLPVRIIQALAQSLGSG